MDPQKKKLVYSQCKISKLIRRLEDIVMHYGDLDVVLWDECVSVTFERTSQLFEVIGDKLYVGGIMANGSRYFHDDPNTKGTNVYSVNDIIPEICSNPIDPIDLVVKDIINNKIPAVVSTENIIGVSNLDA